MRDDPGQHDGGQASTNSEHTVRGFLTRLARDLFRDLVFILLVFLVATGATALVCWYYEVPLFLSLIGGFLVLGIALALRSDSIFD